MIICRNPVKPTSTLSSSNLTVISQQHRPNEQQESQHHLDIVSPSKLPTQNLQNNLQESTVMLEPSSDISLASTRVEPTELLTIEINSKSRNNEAIKGTSRINISSTVKRNKIKTLPVRISKTFDIQSSKAVKNPTLETNVANASVRKTDLKFKESASKIMEIIGTVVHEFIQNSTNEKIDPKPEEVIFFFFNFKDA